MELGFEVLPGFERAKNLRNLQRWYAKVSCTAQCAVFFFKYVVLNGILGLKKIDDVPACKMDVMSKIDTLSRLPVSSRRVKENYHHKGRLSKEFTQCVLFYRIKV